MLNQLLYPGVSIAEQLAVLTKIRQEIANPKTPPDIKGILADTNILHVLSQVLSLAENQSPLVRYLKLEATWILTNIGFGDESDIM